MRVKTIELSPFPGVASVQKTMLTFTAAELKTLARAADILDKASECAQDYFADIDGEVPNASLSDYNMDLALMLCSGYLRNTIKDPQGIRLD